MSNTYAGDGPETASERLGFTELEYSKNGEWQYLCEWQGDIKMFQGDEKILMKSEVVFTHAFIGGLFLSTD